MNNKLQNNVFYNFNKLQNQVNELKEEVMKLKEENETLLRVQRCHLMRVKNGESLSDEYILNGHSYHDFNPEQAYRYYQQRNFNYILLDVSEKNYQPPEEIAEATKIPLEELPMRFKEIVNKAIPILIISEKGIRSILACEMLNQFGFYNVNNISGGYKFWPAFRVKQTGSSHSNKKAA